MLERGEAIFDLLIGDILNPNPPSAFKDHGCRALDLFRSRKTPTRSCPS